MTELEKLAYELSSLNIIKGTFSVPYQKDAQRTKCHLKNFGEKYQFEFFTKTQAFHENVAKNELAEKISLLLQSDFRQCELFTPDYIYALKISSKGRLLHNRRKNTDKTQVFLSHNREKKHIIDIDNLPDVFYDIGIVGKDGKIKSDKYDKYKQICRFIEFIDDVVKNDARDSYNIIDFGCGKSYLTFVCYYYMTKIAQKKVNIIGLDLKEKVIENCNALCKKYNYDSLQFYCMDIKDYSPSVRPDMVIALHACDVATDYALYNAYRWQTDYIFSVPCCQHELNKKIKSDDYSVLCDYGLIKERFSALATDALRAKYLEYCGYDVDVLEFIDIEHSPKNILIRAKRCTRTNSKKRTVIKKKIDLFERQFNAGLTLGKLADKKIEREDGIFLLCGKASMLIRDAMTVRCAVFGDEQGYRTGASRDEKDDSAWLVCAYDRDGNVIGTARMIDADENGARLLGKIAVMQKFRNSGLGKSMIEILQEVAMDEKAKILYVNAQAHALPFYRKMGYDVCSESFYDEGIEMIPVGKKI